MFKPVYNAAGCVTQSISAVASIIPLDADSIGALANALGTLGADHTYLMIGTPPQAEIVRVDLVDDVGMLAHVTRAQDGTQGRAVAAGTPVMFVMTAAAVIDVINSTVSPNNVSVVAGNFTSVVEGPPGTFTVSAMPLNLSSNDNTIDISGSYPDISVDVRRGAFGCCD